MRGFRRNGPATSSPSPSLLSPPELAGDAGGGVSRGGRGGAPSPWQRRRVGLGRHGSGSGCCLFGRRRRSRSDGNSPRPRPRPRAHPAAGARQGSAPPAGHPRPAWPSAAAPLPAPPAESLSPGVRPRGSPHGQQAAVWGVGPQRSLQPAVPAEAAAPQTAGSCWAPLPGVPGGRGFGNLGKETGSGLKIIPLKRRIYF